MPSTRAPRSRSAAVAKAANAGDGSKKIWIIAAVVLVVGLAAVMAVALAGEETASEVRANQTAEVTVTGDPVPTADSDEAAPTGVSTPELSGTSLDGDPMTIDHDGVPKVIGFFTHWCPHCQAEVPEVSEWYNAGDAPDDVDVVAVSTAVNPTSDNYPPSEWFEREDWEVPTLLDDDASSAANAFGLSGYPYWVAVDAEGDLVAQRSGRIGIEELERLIDQARTAA
ncbi:MAG: TlpA family protein disulfide reductase [Acidimicrobiales bacterium]